MIRHIARAIWEAVPYSFADGGPLPSDYADVSDDVRRECEVRARAALCEIRKRQFRVVAINLDRDVCH